MYTAGGPAHTTHARLGSGQALCWTLHSLWEPPLRPELPWTESFDQPLTGGATAGTQFICTSSVPSSSHPWCMSFLRLLYQTGTSYAGGQKSKPGQKGCVGNTSLPPEALEANLFPELYLPKSLMPDPFPPAANPAMWDPASFLTEPRSRVRLPRLL